MADQAQRARELLKEVCALDDERTRCMFELLDVRRALRAARIALAAEMRARELLFLHLAGLPSAVLRADGSIRLVRRRTGR